jgi:hypothetical protein
MTRIHPAAAVILATAASAVAINLADPAHRDLFLSHPVIGDVSYDAFVRSAGNPIYTGTAPYEWPVNGSLFRDSATGEWYCYVGLYPRGYWPAGPARALRTRDEGRSWVDLGIVLQGDARLFDGDGRRPGATPDVTVAQDAEGYHMVYDWATPDNKDGGLGYAFARSPAGPWIRDPRPIHAESTQPIIPPGYKRIYAGSIVRRAKDWLILASMSTPGNGGGMWAFVGMTATSPRGPYSPPVFIHRPQDGGWLPMPVEFFPAFVHEGFVYAANTSVARNRGYQVIFRAPIEAAHDPGAWSAWQAGSLFHAVPTRSEACGIWGQAFNGFVDPHGVFRIMYPARDPDSRGTIHIASRPWDRPFSRGFWLSAPNAPSLGIVQRRFREFSLDLELEASGPWRLLWNHGGPLGPDRAHAESVLSPLTLRDCISLRAGAGGVLNVDGIDAAGQARPIWTMPLADRRTWRLSVRQRAGRVEVVSDHTPLGNFAVPAGQGAIALLAEAGTCIHAREFRLDPAGEPIVLNWLPLEGLLGAGSPESNWKAASFRFGTGFVGSFEGARAKWSLSGNRLRLWSPRGPSYGKANLMLDGCQVVALDLRADTPTASTVVWDSGELRPGHHALLLERSEGELPVDSIEMRVGPN